MRSSAWQPNQFLRFIETVKSSSFVGVIETNAGRAFLKAINNPQGVHILACDWIGTKLAYRFGLKTFEIAILELTDSDEIPLNDKMYAASGPAFLTKAEDGHPVGGAESIKQIENIEDIAKLIIFDTWVRNCDRHGPELGKNGQPRVNQDNLFLSTYGASNGQFILKAIDHGHIFTCGRELTPRLADIEMIKDERLYGCFHFLRPFVTLEQICECAADLKEKRTALCNELLNDLPSAWEVSDETKRAIHRFLLERAVFVADNIRTITKTEFTKEEDL